MYHLIFIVGLIMAIIFLVTSIILYFRDDVSKQIRKLTGRDMRKVVLRIRNQGTRKHLEIKADERAADLPKHTETDLPEEVTLRLCAENETGLLLGGQENPMPAIFEVLEDITLVSQSE